MCHCLCLSALPKTAPFLVVSQQYITMWPDDLSYWPTYRTTGDTREQAQEAVETGVPVEQVGAHLLEQAPT